MTAALIPVESREGTRADLNFVYASWLKSYRPAMPEMRTDDYYTFQHERIERLLARGARIVVLHPVGAPDVIACWACVEPRTVHYVYSKGHEYRRRGFARQLIGAHTVCTHLTEDGVALKKRLGLRYMPHLLDG